MPGEVDHITAMYDGDIRKADKYMGKMFELFRSLNLFENTLFVLTSDHGEELQDRDAPKGVCSKIGHGHALYDEQLLVPLVFCGPMFEPKKEGIRYQVRSIDILPTVLDVLGLPMKDTFQGASLVEMIRGNDRKDRPAYTEATTLGTDRESIRYDGYKYIRRLSYGNLWRIRSQGLAVTPPHELYSLREDPGEIRNLAADEGTTMKTLQELMEQVKNTGVSDRRTAGKRRLPVDVGKDSQVMEQLRELGYIK